MSRLIRIALTLFASATILTILVHLRAKSLQTKIDAEMAVELIRDETRMVAIGMLISGLMIAIGFILIIVEINRKRRSALSDHDQ